MEEELDLEITIKDIKVEQRSEDTFQVSFATSDGDSQAILHHRDGNKSGTVLIGGAGGGFDGPAGIYKDLGPDLLTDEISSLRLDFRWRNDIDECVLDALIGTEFLKSLGVERVGLVGWSFGGAVVIAAGAASEDVRAVVTVASQTYGTDTVDELAKPLLLIHGTGDKTLPPNCSRDIFNRAQGQKELVLYEGANHGVDQNRNEMLAKIEDFLTRYLKPA